MRLLKCFAILVVTGLLLQGPLKAQDETTTEGLREMVEADWTSQEHRRNRTPDEASAVLDAYRRAEQLLDDLRKMPEVPDVASETTALEHLHRQVDAVDSLDKQARLALYRRVRSVTRNMALKTPLIASRPIVFMKRRRFICQMLHEYLGYFYDYEDIEGGGVYVLEKPGRSLKVRDLINGRLPRGNYTTLALSYDGRTIYFAFSERAPSPLCQLAVEVSAGATIPGNPCPVILCIV